MIPSSLPHSTPSISALAPARKQIVSLAVTVVSYTTFIDEVIQRGRQRKPGYACFANVHMLVEAVQNPGFANAVNAATWTTADGVPLRWAMQLLYGQQQERITGLDVLPTLLTEAARQNLSVYFYGSTPAVLSRTAEFCAREHPALRIAGMHSPPFRPLTPDEENQVVAQISASGANLVFVALGCPKQEKWMAALSGRIPAVLLGVGGALPVTVGVQQRAPRWMQQAGLEWLQRLLLEPRRLFSRYFTTNTLFLYHLGKQWLRK